MKKKKLIKILTELAWEVYGYGVSKYEDYTYCRYCGKQSPLPEKGDGEPIKHSKGCIVKLAEKLEKE